MLLVQRVAQHFGLAVDRRALALCAVMALIVNFSAILLSVYLTFNHLLMLIFMVIGSAALVTGVNEYLLRRDYARVAFAGGDAKEKEVVLMVFFDDFVKSYVIIHDLKAFAFKLLSALLDCLSS